MGKNLIRTIVWGIFIILTRKVVICLNKKITHLKSQKKRLENLMIFNE